MLVLSQYHADGLQALLTLNSCPMFTYNERDLHRMPTPARSHLPIKDFIAASGILDDELSSSHNNDADVALLRLPAPSLRGTFAKAYALLAKLVSQIGWDELLKCRSTVFVMEEEYRMQKSTDPADASTATNGHAGEEEGFGPLAVDGDSADEDASVHGISSARPLSAAPDARSAASTPTIPTIKVSTDSDGERERTALAEFEEEAKPPSMDGDAPGLEKPSQAVQGEEESATLPTAGASKPAPQTGSFSNKRLCERWLDNLFMVLYEVCRRRRARA